MVFFKLNNKHVVYIKYIQTWLKLFDCLVGRAIFSLVMEQIFKKWCPNVCNIQM